MLFEAWEHALKSTCGNFSAVPSGGQRAVPGYFREHRIDGMDVASFLCNISMIERTQKDVRQDSQEHLYLVVQLAGMSRMETGDSREVLAPGNLYLIDSTRPLKFRFEGELSKCISLHVPRAALLAEAPADVHICKSIDLLTPASRRLNQHIIDMMKPRRINSRPNPEYTLNLIRSAFAVSNAARLRMNEGIDSRTRYEIALREIERSSTNPDMSLAWLAERVGISGRQLARDFAAFDTSFVATLRSQRLKLFLDMIKLDRRAGRRPRITDIAFAAGFRDISNFNRAFRARFHATPRAFIDGWDAASPARPAQAAGL